MATTASTNFTASLNSTELSVQTTEWSLFTPNNSIEVFEREILEGPRQSYVFQLRIYDIFLPLLAGTIILLNLLVVFSSGLILHKRQQPRSTYIFLGNIGLADMMTGVATVFGQYYPKEIRTEIVCCIQIGLIVSATVASVYSIALIAIDRYFYILHGLKYKQYLSSKRARIMVLGTWIIGGIIGFLPAMGVRNSTQGGRFCWLIILEPAALVLATSSIGVLPLILIFVLYCIILKRALGKIQEQRVSTLSSSRTATGLRYFRGDAKKEENSNGHNFRSRELSDVVEATMNEELKTRRSFLCCFRKTTTIKISSVYNPSRWKAIKIVALTTGCFFITWCPYFLASALYVTCDNSDSAPNYCNHLRLAIASPLAILGLSNSLMNPIIYAWWHNGFRTSAKKLCMDLWHRSIVPLYRSLRRKAPKMAGSKKEPRTKSEDESNTDSTKASTSKTSLPVETIASVHLPESVAHVTKDGNQIST